MPDLITVAPFGFSLSGSKGGTTTQRRLFFSNRIANIGNGPLELRAVNNPTTGLTDAFQEIYTHTDTPTSSTSTTKAGGSAGSTAPKGEPTGSMTLVSTIPVGTFAFHPAHNHWHFQDFARYELRAIEADGSTGAVLRTTDKVSFCIIDTSVHITTIPHFGMGHSHSCGQTTRQGMKVGYADTYVSTLPDQFIDITGVPDGTYRVVSVARIRTPLSGREDD